MARKPHPNSLKNLELGRQDKGLRRFCVTLKPELVEFARQSGNISGYINELLEKAYQESKQSESTEARLYSLLDYEKYKNTELRKDLIRLNKNRETWRKCCHTSSNKLRLIRALVSNWQEKSKKSYNPKWHYAKQILEEIISLL